MSEPEPLCNVETSPGARCIREAGHPDAHVIISDKEQLQQLAREKVCAKCGTKGSNGVLGRDYCSTCGAEP